MTQFGKGKYGILSGVGPYVNHSCDPNCGVRDNEFGAHDYVAMKKIKNGDELTYDYVMGNHVVESIQGKCLCGSEICRTYITGWKELPRDRREAYKGFMSQYVLDLGDE